MLDLIDQALVDRDRKDFLCAGALQSFGQHLSQSHLAPFARVARQPRAACEQMRAHPDAALKARRPQCFQILDGLLPRPQDFGDFALLGERRKANFD